MAARIFASLALLALHFGVAVPVGAQDTRLDSAAIAEFLGEHAAPVRSVHPGRVDFADLEPIRKAVGDARIVMLGEAQHGDGTTYLAKARLVKFLHQEMDFDVLIWESDLYGVAKAWQLIEAGEDAMTAMERSVFGTWTYSQEVQPLIAYVEEQSRSARPLEIAGFDMQFNGSAPSDFLVADLRAHLNRKAIETNALDPGSPLRVTLERGEAVSDAAVLDLIVHLKEKVQVAASEGAEADDEFWLQVLDNMIARGEERLAFSALARAPNGRFRLSSRADSATVRMALDIRDAQMGKNLVWLARNRYPGRKLIVWAATAHLLYGSPVWAGVPAITAGHIAREKLGAEVYQIGFTAYESKVRSSEHDAQLDGIDFDQLMHAVGFELGFLDLQGEVPGGRWRAEPFYASPTGAGPTLEPWSGRLDGLFFIDQIKQSVRGDW